MPRTKLDRRQEKNRAALLHAFRELLLQTRFDEFDVAAVAARAGVARSTLYQHFAGKSGLLAASIAGPFARLTQTLEEADNTRELVMLLEHFHANRGLARALFVGAARGKAMAVLVAQIEGNLKTRGYAKAGRLILPVRLAAAQLAEVLMAPIIAWLAGDARYSAELLASAVRQVARGTLASMSTS